MRPPHVERPIGTVTDVPRCLPLLVLVAGFLVAIPSVSADAAVRSKRSHGVRLTLDGRYLTATIVADWRIAGDLQGHRVQAACGTTLGRLRRDRVFTARRWPATAQTLRFTFQRDVSQRASWCVLEETGGSDLAVARFFEAEPRRLVAEGSTPTGSSWRLMGWRAADRQPCAALRVAGSGGTRSCFDEDAAREARLSVAVHGTGCSRDLFVYGATSHATALVRITLSDGTTAEATRYPRPTGSRVRAQYSLVVLPGATGISSIEALDADGTRIGRRRFADDQLNC